MPDITVSSDIHDLMQSANKAAARANLDLENADLKTGYESNADTNAFTDLEKAKLSAIEASATADQTDSQIKTAYENNSDTNAFTDTEKTKLSGIATGAEVNAVGSVNTQTGSVTLDADNIDDTSTTHKFATAAQLTKIDGVESGATQDQSGSEIKLAYESESDTNAFTDAEKTKLSGIETGATADQDLSSYQLQPSEGAFANGDKTKLDGIETGANVTDAANVNAAGATMNTDTDVSGNSWVLDEDSMSSNDATKVPTQQSVKAYVDANSSSGDATSIQGTNVDSTVGSPSDGDILVYRSSGSDFVLESKPAAGSNPAASDITDATADGIALITSSDANPFTDADESKLDGISTGAEVNAVDSVNTQTGAVVLDADDISDAATTKKFTTASDISKLAGIETGATADQDLSSYQLQPSEGAFANGDKTKLDGIEASANVTDTANVTSAGALMDSEVTNLAQVKAFDSADYATAAQGTKADSAQQPPSEGAFANGDKTKLDGIAAGAEVNVNADWNSSSGDSQISNKPTLGTAAATASSDYATAAQGTTADSAMQDLSDDTTPQLSGDLDVNGNDIVSTSNANIDLAANGTGSVVVRGNDTSGKVVLNCENNSHGVTIKGPPHSAAADYTLTLPNDDGSASQTLTTDGSGNLSWSTPSGSYGNSDVDSHLNTSSASSNQVLSWNGSDYAWTAQSGGGGTGGTSARIISIDAGALVARTTNGAATATEEYATNDVMSDHFLFDGATEEGVQFRFHMPADWDGNAVNAKFYWDAATGASASDGVTWGIAMQAFQNDDALDNAFGTSVDTDDAVTAVGDLHVTALSSDITIAGSPSAGDLVFAEVTRVIGDANDTMTEDAKLVGVTIHYSATTPTDYLSHPSRTTAKQFDDFTTYGLTDYNNLLMCNVGALHGSSANWQTQVDSSSYLNYFRDDDAVGVIYAEENGPYDRATLYCSPSIMKYAPTDGDSMLFECRMKHFWGGTDSQQVSLGAVAFAENKMGGDTVNPGYTDTTLAGIYFEADETYLKSYVKSDNWGTADGVTKADITSVTQSNYINTWYTLAAHAQYDSSNTRWVVKSYFNQTLVATQYITDWGCPLSMHLTFYNNGSSDTNLVALDWASLQYDVYQTASPLQLENI